MIHQTRVLDISLGMQELDLYYTQTQEAAVAFRKMVLNCVHYLSQYMLIALTKPETTVGCVLKSL